MRISNKMVYGNYTMSLMHSEEIINQRNGQISSGRRISQPSDDPIGTSRSMLYRTNLTEISQYTSNSNNAKLLLNSTDDTLVKCDDYLQRVYELVVNGGNDTNSPQTWEPIAAEIDKIRDGLVDLANTNIDGRYIFAGEKILDPAYAVRASVTGDVRNLELNPITIDSRNNQFKVKLDSGNTATISLTSKVYNGTAGKTLDDLAEDIHKQLSQAGFKTPVYARATPDGKISFYAGTQPSDGEHTLVLKDGPAIKYTGKSPGPFVPNQITLAGDANNLADFYSGWNITITKGTGAGQTRTIQIYSGGPGHTATALDSNWTINPNFDSEYVITPPLEGATIAVPLPGANTVTLDPATRSGLANFYNGMDITVTDTNGVIQTRKITGYNNATGVITVGGGPWGLPNVTDFTITPHLSGNVTGFMGLPAPSITLDAAFASAYDDFYNGDSIIATYADGRTETRHITDYNGITKMVSLDGGDWPLPPVSYKICDSALDQLGFENKATTKELLGSSINGLVKVNATYPLAEIASGAAPGSITLNKKDQKDDNYYNNWTIKIINGMGAGQTSTITAYTNAGNTANVIPAWAITPDTTSVYALEPPLMGNSVAPEQSTTTVGAGLNDITLPLGSSIINDHYNNWTITITSGAAVGQSKTITDFDGGTGLASIVPASWGIIPPLGSNYTLTPPSNQIAFTNSSAVNDFYKGMPITIYDGTGKGQIRTITAYDGVNQVATLDKPWDTLPDTSSKYTIDANYYINANNKFKIKVGQELTQEISLDGGEYSPQDLATMVQSKINARGGEYANVQVSATADNRLRIIHHDPDLNDDDNPLNLKLESGSNADLLWKLGFENGIVSEQGSVNFEGNKAGMDYDINVNSKIKVNVVGDSLFDPIFDHLKKISMDLRAGNNDDLTSVDLINVKGDLDRVLATQAEVGSKVNRMEKSLDHLSSFEENINKLLSDVEDADISKVIIDLKMQETAYQAALQSGASILQMTLLDYLR
jgi:flagellin-like hook-associated protein FlgL